MNILGISAFYHDSAACLLRDGEIVAAASEERFTRKKHDAGFPGNAIRYVLGEAGLTTKDIDYIGFYDKPLVKFERILLTYIATFPKSFGSFRKAVPLWLKDKLWVPNTIRKELDYDGEILFGEHHMSHAASCFLVSPFDEAAILTLDGVGEWATATQGVGKGRDVTLLNEIKFPHSLGLLYSAFTYFLGFKVNSAEYKVMGLAPYGEPKYFDRIMEHLIHVNEDGSFKMNMDYFAYDYGLTMTNGKFSRLFDIPVREGESQLEQVHKDLAASVQKVTEEIMLRQARDMNKRTGLTRLCMAGGVALNCVANGRVLRETPFKEIFVQPAAGDAGGAIGVAAYIYHSVLGNERTRVWKHAYLGPAYPANEVKTYIEKQGQAYKEYSREELLRVTAKLIDEQNVVGWFQGRMEFGPRALGNRSILADARNPANKDVVNIKIKFRESFRPFAPTVLEEKCQDWFELNYPSPYMLLVAQVRPDKRTIPSVTHVDGSARIQTISREQNELYYDLVKEFDRQTGCPVIINTSFNVRGEPIVCTPHDAYLCFMRTNMDYLVMDRFVLDKKQMKPLRDDIDWQREFELD
ncbi:MAG TPA: carbamoyltransferase [Patescibacteria group bacterium]|jgi:carbamoyltransferase|nr:carbamoyltransferase [Patescibacteria group bacterium]